MTAFNGGRSQINFGNPQYDGEFPFLNALKGLQNWGFVDGSGVPAPSTLDSNGYPTSISNGGVYSVCFVPTAAQRPGNYVLKWTGAGTVAIPGAVGSPFSGTDQRNVFANPDARVELRITANTNLSNLIYCHVDDEALVDAGNYFGTRFKAKLLEGNFGVLRFLNWQAGNITNIRLWADRKPLTYVYWYGEEYRASMYGGVTGGTTTAYTVTAPSGWGGLVDKAIVIVKFNATATSDTPTLNVGSTGAKTMVRPDTDPIGTYGSTDRPTINTYATLVYDADLDKWIKFGGDSQRGNVFLTNGIPIEAMFQLCVEMGAHPWFTTPYLSCDPIQDWITGLATYCRDNQPSWMIPRFEPAPNESWNSGGGFYGTRYGWAKTLDYWGSADINQWVGKVASTGGQAVSAVYSDNRALYQCIVGCGADQGTSPDTRLTSARYVTDGGSAAKNWATHIASAAYLRSTYSDAAKATAATNYANAVGAPAKLVIATAFVDSVTSNTPADGDHARSLPAYAILYAAFKSWAAGQGVTKMCMYEGGWDESYTGDTNLDALKAASKAVASHQTHLTTNYTNFINAGCEFPSCFQLGGTSIWGLFDPDIYATPSPQWDGIVAFNVFQTRRSGLRLRLHS